MFNQMKYQDWLPDKLLKYYFADFTPEMMIAR